MRIDHDNEHYQEFIKAFLPEKEPLAKRIAQIDARKTALADQTPIEILDAQIARFKDKARDGLADGKLEVRAENEAKAQKVLEQKTALQESIGNEVAELDREKADLIAQIAAVAKKVKETVRAAHQKKCRELWVHALHQVQSATEANRLFSSETGIHYSTVEQEGYVPPVTGTGQGDGDMLRKWV